MNNQTLIHFDTPINNTYTKDNITITTTRINFMKGELKHDDFIALIKTIYNYQNTNR